MYTKKENRIRMVRTALILVSMTVLVLFGRGIPVVAKETSNQDISEATNPDTDEKESENTEPTEKEPQHTDSQGIIYTLQDNKKCYITGYTKDIKAFPSVTIPETIRVNKITYTVAGIRKSALKNCTTLKELKIPNSITEIESNSLKGCTKLSTISILPTKTTVKTADKQSVITIKVSSALLSSSAKALIEADKKTIAQEAANTQTDTVVLRISVLENQTNDRKQTALHHITLQQDAVKTIAKSGKKLKVKVMNSGSGYYGMTLSADELGQITGDLTLSLAVPSVSDLAEERKTDTQNALKKNKLSKKQVKIVSLSSWSENATANITVTAEDIQDLKTGSEVYVYRYHKTKRTFINTSYHAYQVSKKGNITFFVSKGGTYLVSSKKLSAMAEPLCSQFFQESGKTYYADKNGNLVYGWRKIGSDYYYFDRKNGKMASGCTVDGIKLNTDGTAKKTEEYVSKIQTMIKARTIVNEVTEDTDSTSVKMQKVFRWIFQFPYRRYRRLKPIYQEKGWEVTFANDIFDRKQGCCVSEASALAFLFHECGVETVYVCHDTGHAWVEVDNRVYDPLFAEARGISGYYNVSYKQAGLYVVGKRKI